MAPAVTGEAIILPRYTHSTSSAHYAMIQPSRLAQRAAGPPPRAQKPSQPGSVTVGSGTPGGGHIPLVVMQFIGPGVLPCSGDFSSSERDSHVPPRALGASLHSAEQRAALTEGAQAATLAYAEHSVALPFPREPVAVVPVPVSTTDLLPRVIEATHTLLQLATAHAQARASRATQAKQAAAPA